jgi:hypothetical protein
MSVSKDDILEAIANMSVMEVVELIDAMEEKFGYLRLLPWLLLRWLLVVMLVVLLKRRLNLMW